MKRKKEHNGKYNYIRKTQKEQNEKRRNYAIKLFKKKQSNIDICDFQGCITKFDYRVSAVIILFL